MSWFTQVLGNQPPVVVGAEGHGRDDRPDPPDSPTPTPSPSPPTTTTPPTTNPAGSTVTRDQLVGWLRQIAAKDSTVNRSVANDPGYWADRMMQTHPDGNFDWGYWNGRFRQPEGPPEGSMGMLPSTLTGLLAPFQGQMPAVPAANGNMWQNLLSGGQTSNGQTLSDFLAQYQPARGATA